MKSNAFINCTSVTVFADDPTAVRGTPRTLTIVGSDGTIRQSGEWNTAKIDYLVPRFMDTNKTRFPGAAHTYSRRTDDAIRRSNALSAGQRHDEFPTASSHGCAFLSAATSVRIWGMTAKQYKEATGDDTLGKPMLVEGATVDGKTQRRYFSGWHEARAVLHPRFCAGTDGRPELYSDRPTTLHVRTRPKPKDALAPLAQQLLSTMNVESDPEVEDHEMGNEEDQPNLEPVADEWPTPQWHAVNR
jgi:hypothetical protein